ncbi:MAG: hypothetical protein OIF57_10070 [Marinobacterium sp.]|nr:hypothetical protein [Marinobacterium sp.]
MDLICIDFEASGLGPRSYPIEVAWKDASSGRQDAFLINPQSVKGWDWWDEFAEELHGIDHQMLAHQGISVIDAARRLNQALTGRIVISDAWEFDRFWMTRLFEAAGVAPEFELTGLESLLSDSQLVQYRFIARSQMRRHRAANDVEDQLAAIDVVRQSCETVDPSSGDV